jgi:general secretion pathway protein D
MGAHAQVPAPANNTVEINFRDLEITDFVRLVSNVLGKNILLQDAIPGKVEFVSTSPVTKKDLPQILQSVLATKGYTLVDHGSYMEVVRNNVATQYNLPVSSGGKITQMTTQVITIKGLNVDEVANKIRHLASIAAKIVTVRENNALVITDFPQNIATIKKVINLMERDTSSDVEFIKLDRADIGQVFPVIQSIGRNIFNEKVESERVSIYENKADNGIIAVGSKENIEKLRDVVARLDLAQESFQMVTKVIPLNNTEAKDIQKVVTELITGMPTASSLTGGNRTTPINPQAMKRAEENKPVISIDEASNSIVVLATQREYEIIASIVKELDREQKQVFVKARVIEISENRAHQIGVQYGLEYGRANSDGLFTFAMNMGGAAVAVSDVLASVVKLEAIKSALALGATVNFLKTNGAADVISEPSVLCVNNQESKIYVGQTESIATGTTQGTSTTDLSRTSYTREDIGLTLKVKPRISNDNKVSLEIETTVEDVLPGGLAGMPTTTKREVTPRAIVRSGESVIVGGLIRNKASETVNKVPLLGDIPILGHLFSYDSQTGDQLNIVIMLTPYVVNSSEDLSRLREQLAELDNIQQAYTEALETNLQKRLKEQKAKEAAERDEGTSENTPVNPAIDSILNGN